MYRKAREFREDILSQEIKNPMDLKFFDDASPDLLKRIVEGAKVSDDLTAKFLDYLK